MNCKSVQSQLSSYLDRELSNDEMYAIRAHLSECDGCRREEHELQTLKSLLGGMNAPEPPVGFDDRILRTIETGHKPHPHSARPALMFFTAVAVGALGVAVALSPTSVRTQTEAENSHSRDIQSAVARDQAYRESGDPYGAGAVGIPTGYER